MLDTYPSAAARYWYPASIVKSLDTDTVLLGAIVPVKVTVFLIILPVSAVGREEKRI